MPRARSTKTKDERSAWWNRYAAEYGRLERTRYRVIEVPIANDYPPFVVHEYLIPSDLARLQPDDYREVARFWEKEEADCYVRNRNSKEEVRESAIAMREASSTAIKGGAE